MAALASEWLKHFRLLLCTNSTKLDRMQYLNILYEVRVFTGRSEKQDGCSGLWLTETFSTSPLKPLNEIRHLTGSKISTFSTKFVFLCRSEKYDGHPDLWFAETFSTAELLNGIQRNLIGSKISTSSTKFVFFGPNEKARWPPRCLIGWYIFDLSSDNAEQNSAKRDKGKISTSSTKSVVFFLPISKQKWPPSLIRQKGGVLYSGALYVALWVPCFVFPPEVMKRRSLLLFSTKQFTQEC